MPDAITDKSGRGILFVAIKAAAESNGYPLDEVDVSFGSVEPSENESREVQVMVSASEESPFTGSQTVYFNRLDLANIFTAAGVESVVFEPGFTTTGELITQINSAYGLGFTEDDLAFDTPIAPEDTSVVLSALPGSYGFTGSLTVSLEAALVDMVDAMGDGILDDVDASGLVDDGSDSAV